MCFGLMRQTVDPYRKAHSRASATELTVTISLVTDQLISIRSQKSLLSEAGAHSCIGFFNGAFLETDKKNKFYPFLTAVS